MEKITRVHVTVFILGALASIIYYYLFSSLIAFILPVVLVATIYFPRLYYFMWIKRIVLDKSVDNAMVGMVSTLFKSVWFRGQTITKENLNEYYKMYLNSAALTTGIIGILVWPVIINIFENFFLSGSRFIFNNFAYYMIQIIILALVGFVLMITLCRKYKMIFGKVN